MGGEGTRRDGEGGGGGVERSIIATCASTCALNCDSCSHL